VAARNGGRAPPVDGAMRWLVTTRWLVTMMIGAGFAATACGGAARGPEAVRSGPSERAYDARAEYRAVHIDTLAPDKVDAFVAARRDWVAALDAAHVTDGRGVFIQVGDHRMYTIRSFAGFAELDERSPAFERALAMVGA